MPNRIVSSTCRSPRWLDLLLSGLVAILFIPLIETAHDSQRSCRYNYNSCVSNLKQVDSAKEQLGMDKQLKPGAEVSWTDLIGQTLYLKNRPACDKGGTYDLTTYLSNPTCSYPGHGLR